MLPKLPPMVLQGWWAALTQHTTNCTMEAEGTIGFPLWLVLCTAVDRPNLQNYSKHTFKFCLVSVCESKYIF